MPMFFKENKDKAGIYRWTNLINNKSYVGSSTNLGKRFRNYLKILFLENIDMVINKALLKSFRAPHKITDFVGELRLFKF
jgi:excinuclease UvrABC nuclease subunit